MIRVMAVERRGEGNAAAAPSYLYRVANNRIAEHFGRFDELGMLEQLGIAHDLEWPGSRQEPT